MSFSRSDFDDIIVGDTFAIVCFGDRRWRIEGLSPEQLRALSDGSTDADAVTTAVLARLDNGSLSGQTPGSRCPLLSSRHTTLISRPWSALTGGEALTLVSVFSLSLGALGATHLWWGSATLTSPSPPLAAITLLPLVLASFAAHELGHAAACLRHTGATGGIAVELSWRGLKLAVDVSSQGRAPRRAKVAIALAGPMFQIAFGAAVTFVGLMLSSALPLYAGLLIMALSVRYLIPCGSTDGYWALWHATGVRPPDTKPRHWSVRLLDGARGLLLVFAAILGLVAVLQPLPGA